MATKNQAKFVEIGKLIKSPLSKLNGKQLDVVKAHRAAAKAWNKFVDTGKNRTIGIIQHGFPQPPKEEFKASNLALIALRKAIEYYHSHEKLEKAYSEVKEVASAHWHPVVREMWHHHFERRAHDADIEIHGKLAERIAQELQEDVNATLHAVHIADNPREKPN